MTPVRLAFVWLIALLLVGSGAWAQDDPAEDAAPKKLRIVVAGSEPFVTEDATDGLSIAVWRAVADKADLEFELQPGMRGVKEALHDVADGRADVAIGPISITAERSKHVRFTQPYFQSHLAIMGRGDKRSTWDSISPYLSMTFFVVVCVLFGILLMVGTLLWLTERKANPEQFPKNPVRGIGNGIWCAIVTATSVGYGDRVPLTVPGRVIAGVWMVLAIFGASSLTATIASVMTVVQLETAEVGSPRDLSGQRVAVVRGTTGADFAKRHGGRLVERETLPEAIALAEKGHADKVVFDRPMLVYHLQQNPEAPFLVSPGGYEPQGYGFAVNDANLQSRVNVALLQLAEERAIDNIRARWLGAVE